jgi:hypothetical protein
MEPGLLRDSGSKFYQHSNTYDKFCETALGDVKESPIWHGIMMSKWNWIQRKEMFVGRCCDHSYSHDDEPLTVHSAGDIRNPTLIPTQDTHAQARFSISTSERNVKKYTRERTPRRCQRTCKEITNPNALKSSHPSLKDIQHSHELDQTKREERETTSSTSHQVPRRYLQRAPHCFPSSCLASAPEHPVPGRRDASPPPSRTLSHWACGGWQAVA